MSFTFRKVVTGHNADALAVVRSDEKIVAGQRLPGYYASTVWRTTEFPICNDEGRAEVPSPAKGSRTLLRIAEMRADEPASQQMHRTETLDYAVILSGECDMLLDSGECVERLKTGDVVIQRGTNHQWKVVGKDPCRLLFVLLDADPVVCGDKVLGDFVDNFGGAIHPMG